MEKSTYPLTESPEAPIEASRGLPEPVYSMDNFSAHKVSCYFRKNEVVATMLLRNIQSGFLYTISSTGSTEKVARSECLTKFLRDHQDAEIV